MKYVKVYRGKISSWMLVAIVCACFLTGGMLNAASSFGQKKHTLHSSHVRKLASFFSLPRGQMGLAELRPWSVPLNPREGSRSLTSFAQPASIFTHREGIPGHFENSHQEEGMASGFRTSLADVSPQWLAPARVEVLRFSWTSH